MVIFLIENCDSFYKSEFLKVFHGKLKWFGIDPHEDESDFGIYWHDCSCDWNHDHILFSCDCGWSEKITKVEHVSFQSLRNYVTFSEDYYDTRNHLKEFTKSKNSKNLKLTDEELC